jgi:2-oxoglutarate ferredoxin oxidoreductase subunit alpha
LRLQAKYREIEKNEVRVETYKTDDAEYIFTGFGLAARICKKAADIAREKGYKVGVIRPITVYPFPYDAYRNIAGKVKGIFDIELNAGQMVEDVKLAVEGKCPVEWHGRMGGMITSPAEILDNFEKLFIKK